MYLPLPAFMRLAALTAAAAAAVVLVADVTHVLPDL
jgi:hypothetical protein